MIVFKRVNCLVLYATKDLIPEHQAARDNEDECSREPCWFFRRKKFAGAAALAIYLLSHKLLDTYTRGESSRNIEKLEIRNSSSLRWKWYASAVGKSRCTTKNKSPQRETWPRQRSIFSLSRESSSERSQAGPRSFWSDTSIGRKNDRKLTEYTGLFPLRCDDQTWVPPGGGYSNRRVFFA